MMTEERTYADDVADVVSAFKDAVETGEITDTESADEWLWQTIDGHSRVIYTAKAKECLYESTNDGAYFEDFGSEGAVKDGSLNWSAFAFCAFRQDVLEALSADGIELHDEDTFLPGDDQDSPGDNEE